MRPDGARLRYLKFLPLIMVGILFLTSIETFHKLLNANNRQGTQSAKTRRDVRGGGRKPFRQKGTGRARQGSTTDPTKVGGGVAFAPKPRSYSYTLPKKVKKLAMISALSSKAQNKELIVLDKLEIADYRTKDVVEMLKNVKAAKKALIVTADKDEKVVKSAANIPNVETTNVSRMNVYEIVNHTNFIATKAAIEKICTWRTT